MKLKQEFKLELMGTFPVMSPSQLRLWFQVGIVDNLITQVVLHRLQGEWEKEGETKGTVCVFVCVCVCVCMDVYMLTLETHLN